jgi:AAHS family 4-hydroxybenzoate transporter-like MFS transporter
MDFASVFAVVAVPGLIATVALLVKQFAHPEQPQRASEPRGEALGH